MRTESGEKFGIVVTIGNEADNLKRFVCEVEKVMCHHNFALYLVFDDHSNDGSFDIARRLAAKDSQIIVRKVVNAVSITDSYLDGFSAAVNDNCDWVIDINGGFRHDPSEILNFIDAIDCKTEFFLGSRFSKPEMQRFSNYQRYFLSFYGTKIASFCLGIKLEDFTSGFHMMSRKCTIHLIESGLKSKYHFLQTEMRFLLCQRFIYKTLPITYNSNSGSLRWKVIFEACCLLLYLTLKRFTR